jgi:flagellar protein FlbD
MAAGWLKKTHRRPARVLEPSPPVRFGVVEDPDFDAVIRARTSRNPHWISKVSPTAGSGFDGSSRGGAARGSAQVARRSADGVRAKSHGTARKALSKDGAMIVLTRLNGDKFALNCDLVERVDAHPDTVLTLVDGTKYLVTESIDTVVELVRDFRAGVLVRASELSLPEARRNLRLVPEEL